MSRSALALLVAVTALTQYAPDLQYQKRGDRFEGVRAGGVSGYDVELLSASVESSTLPAAWPDTAAVSFFLPESMPVHLVVRQLRPRATFYWLDRIAKRDWVTRQPNVFSWSAQDVLKKIGDLKPEDVGVVVRLENELPGRSERVAPAMLLPPGADWDAGTYRFTFKTNGRANVEAAIRAEGQKDPVYQRPASWVDPGSPFVVRWRAESAPEGWYRMTLSGFFAGSNLPLDKEVRFFHKRQAPAR